MSKILIVVRHGHAVEGEADFARRLSDRGVSEVNSAGHALAQRGIQLDGVLTSSASRAAQTAKLLADRLSFEGPLQQARELYLAEATTILQRVCATDDEIDTLLLVGHNPGLSAFVEHMTGQVCELHTAQVVHLKLDVEQWSEASF
jgi:phosphohistidine phosphatase